MQNNKENFTILKRLLQKHSKGLDARESIIDSKAKVDKPSYHLYGKRSVSVAGRKPQPTYVAGIILQKHFTGFYFMPVYSHPKKFRIDNEDLRKTLKGKSCFNIKNVTPSILAGIESLLRKGIALYKEEQWI